MSLVMLPCLVRELPEQRRCRGILCDRGRELGEFLHLEEHFLTCFMGVLLLGDEGTDVLYVCVRHGYHCWRATDHLQRVGLSVEMTVTQEVSIE